MSAGRPTDDALDSVALDSEPADYSEPAIALRDSAVAGDHDLIAPRAAAQSGHFADEPKPFSARPHLGEHERRGSLPRRPAHSRIEAFKVDSMDRIVVVPATTAGERAMRAALVGATLLVCALGLAWIGGSGWIWIVSPPQPGRGELNVGISEPAPVARKGDRLPIRGSVEAALREAHPEALPRVVKRAVPASPAPSDAASPTVPAPSRENGEPAPDSATGVTRGSDGNARGTGTTRPVATPSATAARSPEADAAPHRPLAPVPETPPATIPGWTVRDLVGDAVVLEGPNGTWTAARGDAVPGLGRVESVVRWGNRLIVTTERGLVSTN